MMRRGGIVRKGGGKGGFKKMKIFIYPNGGARRPPDWLDSKVWFFAYRGRASAASVLERIYSSREGIGTPAILLI